MSPDPQRVFFTLVTVAIGSLNTRAKGLVVKHTLPTPSETLAL
jgi:hypothetical protein